MAKAGIHPDYHNITVIMTDGSRFSTRSTYGKEGDTITLDVDPKSHAAWIGGVNLRQTGRTEKFNNRFGGLTFGATAATEEKKEEKKDNAA